MENLIIIGLGKSAHHVYEFVKSYDLYNIVGFAVNKEYKQEETFLGYPVYTLEHLVEEYGSDDFSVFIAVMWNHLNKDRKQLFEYCDTHNFKMVNLISPTARIRSKIAGRNCWIHDFVVVQNNASLADDIFVMAFSLIGANTKVASHCFFAARSLLGGGSTIGEQSFVGLNSIIFDDTTIGNKCIVGACTSVKRNMPDFSKCIISSDNVIFKEYTSEDVENKLVFAKNKR